MNISEANMIFRKSIIGGFFEPQLADMGFEKSDVKHPGIPDAGLMQSRLLHVFFDVETGSDYPDGDEWFIVDMLFSSDKSIPDSLRGPDFFTAMSADDGKNLWHHREMIRYKYGKSKKLAESLAFLTTKYAELHSALAALGGDLR